MMKAGFGILEDCMLCDMRAKDVLAWLASHDIFAFVEYDEEFVGGVSEIRTAEGYYADHFSIEFDSETGLSDASGWKIWD